MTVRRTIFAADLLALAASAAQAQEAPPAPGPVPTPPAVTASLTLTLESAGNIERTITLYQCDDEQTVSVQYINAAPNFLAIVPVEGETLVMTTTLSGSGARYVGGPYEWWSHQGEATLRDLTQHEEAAPLATCTETSNTP
jgi:membrane-bound inhibitor of C-type lysozyme